jgi:uncharacterized protein
MRRFLLVPILALAFANLAIAQEKPKYDMQVLQLVFLVDPKEQLPKDKATATMEQHLAFLENLWKERKALLVGPLKGAGHIHGLIVLDVRTKAEAEEIVKNEPFVKEGSLAMEIHPWFVARNVPQQGPKFLDIEPYWFGMLKRPKDAPSLTKDEAQKIQAGHMANIEKMAASGDLVLAGPMGEDTDFRGIFIFRTADKKRVERLAAKDPAIKRNRLKLELYQWFTAKGTFPKAK